MKKSKIFLLPLVAFSTIAIATPIVLTSCSTSTNSQNTGVKPSFEKDNTNSSSFKLETNSEAQKILDKYKAAEGKEAAEQVLTNDLQGFPKKESKTLVNEVLNMWSNNNWFTITQTAKDAKVKETFISKMNIKKAEVDATSGKLSVDVEYKNAFTDSKNRVFEATQTIKGDGLDVDANTTSIEIPKIVPKNYLMDGKEQPLNPTSLLETNTEEIAKINFENNLKQDKVLLDAKQIFTTFIKNHNILHAEKPSVPNLTAPTWNEARVKAKNGLSIDSSDKRVVILQVTDSGNRDWENMSSSTSYEKIKEIVFTNKFDSVIKTLIDLNDYKDAKVTVGTENKGDNGKSSFDGTISFTKNNENGNDTNPTLIFRVNGFNSTTTKK